MGPFQIYPTYAFHNCTKPAATMMLLLWKALIKSQLMRT